MRKALLILVINVSGAAVGASIAGIGGGSVCWGAVLAGSITSLITAIVLVTPPGSFTSE